MIDPVWAGVIGAAAGGLIASATALLAPLINWKTEEKRLVKEQENALALADKAHAHEIALAEDEARREDRTFKRSLVAEWRKAVRDIHDQFVKDLQTGDFYPHISPVNRLWFETLSPHLKREDPEIEALYSLDPSWQPGTAEAMFKQIARIEREWKLF